MLTETFSPAFSHSLIARSAPSDFAPTLTSERCCPRRRIAYESPIVLPNSGRASYHRHWSLRPALPSRVST